MKKHNIILMVLLLISLKTSLVFADAKANNISAGIPKSVLEKADLKVIQNRDEIPEIRAWETDLKGNKVEVTPKNLGLNLKNSITPLAPPRDGYIYVFNSYIPSTARKNWYYENLGTYRVANQTDTTASAKYQQLDSRTSEWSVSANINAEARAGASFLAQIKAKLGVRGGYSRNWTRGTTFATEYKVPPKTIYYLTNYQVGLNSTGSLLYNRYHPSGGSAGVYTETAGGTAVSMDDISIELTDYEPIK